MKYVMRKLIHSYSIATGVVHFADDTKELFTPEAAAMVEKIIYILATQDGNFQETEVSYEGDGLCALDLVDDL